MKAAERLPLPFFVRVRSRVSKLVCVHGGSSIFPREYLLGQLRHPTKVEWSVGEDRLLCGGLRL